MWLLIALNVLIYYHMSTLPQFQFIAFVQRFGFIPAAFFGDPAAEAFSLVSSMFLHGGLYHLVSNMFFLFVFGDNIEDRMGHVNFALFYLLGGVAATLIHGLFSVRSPIPMVGASGAISAVLGAYFVVFPRQRVLTFIPPLLLPWLIITLLVPTPRFFLIWLPAWLYIGYWAAVQFLEATGGLLAAGGMTSGIAWWAHVGGFVFGVLSVRLFLKR
jgi:membrane associated rhomboid family serine protease